MPTSSIRFVREWREFTRPDGSIIYRPILPILVRGQHGFLPRYFLVDSGADLSMAPYELFRQLGRRWQDGEPMCRSHKRIPERLCARRRGVV